MLPEKTVVLVNADFESRKGELSGEGPRAYEADAAVLETAREVRLAIAGLGVAVEELRITTSLEGLAQELARRGVSTVFNLVESIDNDYGREWQVPAYLARHGIGYTGNGERPLRLCRTKDRARGVLARAGVRVSPGFVTSGVASLSDAQLAQLSYPVFVKPARVDGSIGIDRDSICSDAQAVRARVALLEARLPGPFLVEGYLPGKEINVAIFPGPHEGHVVATEIDFSAVPSHLPPIVTYDGKWDPKSPEYAARSVPAQLSQELAREVDAQARRAFIALGGTGYGRVDMRLDGEGRPCVIDVNPNNDIHPEAGLAIAAASRGHDYPQLISAVLENAVEVHRAATTHPSK
jgi:D-alanine-D-alanine ligase